MEPRTDAVGVVLNQAEAVMAVSLDTAARTEETKRHVIPNELLSTPIGIDLSDETAEYRLDEVQTRRLWRVAFWATAQYLNEYKEISGHHEEVLLSGDAHRPAVAEYLFDLEVLMKVEAERYRTAKQFALDVDRTRDYSRSQLMSESRS